MSNKISCIVLSAGYSSRMKDTHKSLLPIAGYKSMIEKVISNLLECGIEDVYVVLGYNENEIAKQIENLNVTTIYNDDYDKGMFSSVYCGISALKPAIDATLLLPVDAALVKTSTILSLLERRKNNSINNIQQSVIIPTFLNKCGHPPLIERIHFKNILDCYKKQHLKENQFGLRGYFSSLLDENQKESFFKGEASISSSNTLNTVDFFSMPDEGIISDIDTYEDYKHAIDFLTITNMRENPSLNEAFHLLLYSDLSSRTKKHSFKVALGALRLGIALKSKINIHFDELNCLCGGLLHDICRSESRHAKVGAELIRKFGWFRMAAVVASHTNLPSNLLEKFDIFLKEEKLYVENVEDFIEDNNYLFPAFCVYLADKFYQSDNHITLQERHSNIKERYSDSPQALLAIQSRENVALAVKDYFDKTTSLDAFSCVEEKTTSILEKEFFSLLDKYKEFIK